MFSFLAKLRQKNRERFIEHQQVVCEHENLTQSYREVLAKTKEQQRELEQRLEWLRSKDTLRHRGV